MSNAMLLSGIYCSDLTSSGSYLSLVMKFVMFCAPIRNLFIFNVQCDAPV
uniref:Uncharacterized protein n=1 Tax=Arundo donax TaxID=35708 RepID=A0A0A9FMD8_ARUDO